MEDHKPPHPLFAGLGYQSLARSALKIDRPRAQKLWDAENWELQLRPLIWTSYQPNKCVCHLWMSREKNPQSRFSRTYPFFFLYSSSSFRKSLLLTLHFTIKIVISSPTTSLSFAPRRKRIGSDQTLFHRFRSRMKKRMGPKYRTTNTIMIFLLIHLDYHSHGNKGKETSRDKDNVVVLLKLDLFVAVAAFVFQSTLSPLVLIFPNGFDSEGLKKLPKKNLL